MSKNIGVKAISIIWPTFILKDDMIFIDEIIGSYIYNGRFKTDTEAAENHIHIENYFGESYEEQIKIGEIICEIWSLKLKVTYPHRNFKIYLFKDEDIVIRFHQMHVNEPSLLDEVSEKEMIKTGKLKTWQVIS